jgi:hypothetical protein
MNVTESTNDCVAYINKLVNMASNSSPGSLIISASQGRYTNTNWYFDDAQAYEGTAIGLDAVQGVESNGVSSLAITYTPTNATTHITAATNVAGYFTWGSNGGLPAGYATNDTTILFFGSSTWYIMMTGESYNGQRVMYYPQGNFLSWYATKAFGGTNYSNTPVGAVSHVDELQEPGLENSSIYFGLWASENNFAICAWNARRTPKYQVVGDPFIKK